MDNFEAVQAKLATSFRAERVVFASMHEDQDGIIAGWYKLVSDKGPEWTITFWGEPSEAINLAWKIAAPYAMIITISGEPLTDAHDDHWHVEIERHGAAPFETVARENRFSTLNRAWAHELACLFSREGVTGCVGKVSKWSRIRTIYEAGWVMKEFKDVPYTNGPDDWND